MQSLAAAASDPSTLDRIKGAAGNAAQQALKAANWGVRQVKVLAEGAWNLLVRIVNAIKPVFVKIANFVKEYAEVAKEFLVTHKEKVFFASIGVGIGIVLTSLVNAMFGKSAAQA